MCSTSLFINHSMLCYSHNLSNTFWALGWTNITHPLKRILNKQFKKLLSLIHLDGTIVTNRHYTCAILIEINRPHNAIMYIKTLCGTILLQRPDHHFLICGTIYKHIINHLPRNHELLIRWNSETCDPTSMITEWFQDSRIRRKRIIGENGHIITTWVKSVFWEAETTNSHWMI